MIIYKGGEIILMKICLKCRRQLFDRDIICDKCKSDIIMDKAQFDSLYEQFRSSTDIEQEKLRLLPEYKEICEYVFPVVKKPTTEERKKQRILSIEMEQQKKKEEQEYVEKHIKHIYPTATNPSETNLPICPFCKSSDLNKITTIGRVISIGTFGLASGKIGKQWHCNNCGSNF